jgi:hypothetical protein
MREPAIALTTIERRASLALFIVFVFSMPSMSQVVKKHGPATIREFDPSAESLTPNFKGTSLAAIYSRYVIEKDEFETSEQFDRRKSQLPRGIFAFRLKDHAATYDADAGAMTFSLFAQSLPVGPQHLGEHGGAWIAEHIRTVVGKAPAQNAFGASFMVTFLNEKVYALSDPTARQFLELMTPVTPEVARTLKKNSAVILIAEVGPHSRPAALGGEDSDERQATGYRIKEATLDSPESGGVYYHVLPVRISGFWIYDVSSGRVIDRISAR